MVRLFNHYIPKGILGILLLEAFILAGSMYIALLFWAEPEAGVRPGDVSRALAEFSGVMLASMMLMGLYTTDPEEGEGWRGTLMRVTVAFVLGFSVLAAVSAALAEPGGAMTYPLGLSMAIALVAISIERLMFARWRRVSLPLLPRVLVLGTGSRAAQVDAVQRHGHPVRVVGYLPVKEENHAVSGDKLLRRESGETLWQFAIRWQIDEIIVGVRDRRDGGLPVDELLECKLRGVRVTDISSYFERERGQVRLDSLNSSWLIFGDGFMQSTMRNITKRLFDIAASGALLLVTFPIMLLTAALIRMTMGAPVFYWQERVGRDGQVFRICKFRSMRNDAESDGQARWASTDDDRTTPVGRVIRKLRIDELPQVFNVFRGEMSFVGPRPERPQFVRELTEQIPFYQIRHSIRPGITGWAQVRYPYGASVEDAKEKLQYDLYYVKNRGLFLDLTILMQTVEVVLWGRGSR